VIIKDPTLLFGPTCTWKRNSASSVAEYEITSAAFAF